MVKVLHRVEWVLWLGLIFCLPFSSVPLIATLTRSSAVAPLSLLFLIPLVILVLPGLFIRQQPLPLHLKPLIAFFLFSIVTIVLAFFRFIPDYKAETPIRAAVEGLITLSIGFLFYLATITMTNSSEKLQKTLQVLTWCGALLIFWSVLQIVVKFYIPFLRPVMNEIQGVFSLTRILKTRMVGFAYEPSWLAHMLNLTFISYWLASTLNRTSAHQFRIWKFSLENLLLIGGIVVLIGTFSRGGLGAFMLVLFLLFVLGNFRLVKWLSVKWNISRRRWLTAIVILGMIVVYLALLFTGLFVLSKVDPRMETVFQINTSEKNPFIQYADELQFGERMVYWQAGWTIFNDHPILGVGVGFSGFYFPSSLPDIGWELTESRELLYRTPGLLNIKNLWVRILAETGIVGFALFLTFLLISLFTSIDSVRNGMRIKKTLGWMGIFMIVALLLEGFSVDSFALPYIWFTLGLSATGWRWGRTIMNETNG